MQKRKSLPRDRWVELFWTSKIPLIRDFYDDQPQSRQSALTGIKEKVMSLFPSGQFVFVKSTDSAN